MAAVPAELAIPDVSAITVRTAENRAASGAELSVVSVDRPAVRALVFLEERGPAGGAESSFFQVGVAAAGAFHGGEIVPVG